MYEISVCFSQNLEKAKLPISGDKYVKKFNQNIKINDNQH